MNDAVKPAVSDDADSHQEIWCQPADQPKRQFLVLFDDPQMDLAVFTDEAEARAYWEKANINWTCYLMGTLPRSALAAQGQPAAVKALEWLRETPTEWKPETWKADTLAGEYDIQREKDGTFSVFAPNAGTDIFSTLEAAKAAAQSDYETRIRSALAAPAQPVGVPGVSDDVFSPAKEVCRLMEIDQSGRDISWRQHLEVAVENLRASLAAPQPPAEGGWKSMESAPVGKSGYSWMLLAYGPEGDQSVSGGMRFQDKFYAGATFYIGGPFDQKQYGFKELEVTPTHWMPLPPAPANGGEQNG